MAGSFACLTLAATVLGCASLQPPPPPGIVVAVTDVKSLSGKWVGTLIDRRNMGTPAQIIIDPDGTYAANFGITSARGTVAVQPDGQLAFTMTSGSGVLGVTDSASTATLYDRDGKRVLVGNGRVGFYQTPFSWEVMQQK